MNPLMRPFENDTFLKQELENIILGHKVKSVVETGTEYGGSANAFARMEGVQVVVTIDIERKFTPSDLLPNVHFILGDSRNKLEEAIRYITEPGLVPTLFFLDAHTSIETDTCPLRNELAIIGNFFSRDLTLTQPIIVVHDCKVPGTNFGFDTYQDGPICWEGIVDLVEEIYLGHYVRRYNNQASGSRRGCMFIEPL